MKTYEGYVEVDKNRNLRFALTGNNEESYTMFAKNRERARSLFSPRSRIVSATLLIREETEAIDV